MLTSFGAGVAEADIEREWGKHAGYLLLSLWCPGPESNRHGRLSRGILSPLRLPVPPPGLGGMVKDLEAGVGFEPASTALQAAA